MKIIYPPLVEESIRFHLSRQKQEVFNKAEMYRHMVETGIISENGLPTAYALQQGWIKEFYEEADLTLADFLAMYPIFNHYTDQLQKIDGFWEIPVSFKELLLQDLAEGKFTYDEQVQLREYLADR